MRHQTIIVLFLSIFLIGASGKVKLYLDDSFSNYIMVNKQDCEIHKIKKNNYYIGFKAGNFFFNAGPEIGLHKEKGIQWDNALQGVILRYQSLCSKFNTGSVTKEEYDKRWKEFENLGNEVVLFQEKMKRRIRRDAMEAFQMLERDIGLLGMKSSAMDFDTTNISNVSKEIALINRQIEELPPIRTIKKNKSR